MKIKEIINDRHTTIVDVRTPAEFAKGNVRGSINIPLDRIVEKTESLIEMQPLVLCCLSGVRSGRATKYLHSQGCKDVYNGGGWQEVQGQRN